MPSSVRLDPDTERRLDTLARATGRSRAYYIREAIVQHIDDLEDVYLAEKRLEDLRAGRGRTYTIEEVEHELGLAD
ncbi:MAG: DUF6290 family protein [Nitrococcus sp.]|nr:DUF6290 family protein [Nitrococcus sp.]